MQVFRVAHPGYPDQWGVPVGPYGREGVPEATELALNDMNWQHLDDTHPSPHDDGRIRGIRYYERCGFATEAGLVAWFEAQWRSAMHEPGFRVFEYEVPASGVRVGAFDQAVFDPTVALLTAVREIPNE